MPSRDEFKKVLKLISALQDECASNKAEIAKLKKG